SVFPVLSTWSFDTLSLHDALPILHGLTQVFGRPVWLTFFAGQLFSALALWFVWMLGREFTTPRKAFIAMLIVSTSIYFSLRGTIDRKSTRLNSSHVKISYAVFCLK